MKEGKILLADVSLFKDLQNRKKEVEDQLQELRKTEEKVDPDLVMDLLSEHASLVNRINELAANRIR